MRPVYVQAAGENNPNLLRKVVVEYNGQVQVDDTLPGALRKFDAFKDYPVQGTTPTGPQQPTGPTQPSLTAQQYIEAAQKAFADADAALAQGDFATFGQKYNEAKSDLDKANELLGGSTTTSSTTTTTTTVAGA